MNYKLKTTTKFKKDYKRCSKRGCDMNILKCVIKKLLEGEMLEEKYYYSIVFELMASSSSFLQDDIKAIMDLDSGYSREYDCLMDLLSLECELCGI